MAVSNLKTFKISTLLNGTNGKLSIKNGIITQMPVSPDIDLVNVAYMPIIRNKDNAKQLPNYTMALQRVADDYLPAEDLDNIQLELETLLSSVALRSRVLKSEIESLDKDERRIERRLKQISGIDKQPGSPMSSTGISSSLLKRKRDEITLVRKPKNVVGNSVLKQSKHAKKSPSILLTEDSLDCTPTMTTHNNLHHQHHHHHHHQLPGRDNHQNHHHHHHHHHMQKLSVPKNDTPNKFWLSVEPYCMPITNEDLRMLDDLVDQYSGPLIPPLPELGSHYSISWANESLKEIQQISNVNSNFNRMKHQNNDILKKADGILGKGVTGQLTQRLVSALVEEQLIQNPMEIAAAAITETSNSSSENTHSTQLNFRSLAMFRNCIDIEKRVKKELLEQGILDVNDFPNDNDDEILGEIKRLTTELSSIAEYNSAALKRLQDAAKQEIKRLEIKRKLDIVDQEILETFKRTMANKVKRRPLTAEEQQDIFRLTAEQKSLSDQLERISANYVYD